MSVPAPRTDEALVERIARGDRNALAELYARYRQLLFAYLFHLTGDRAIAEEVLQETLVAVWRSAGSFRARSSARTWLIGIARRQAHNVLRRATLPTVDETEAEGVASDNGDPEALALAAIDRQVLASAIGRLAPHHREVLLLTFLHGLSYEETAGVLGVPVGTVRSRLSHARRVLRGLLEPHVVAEDVRV